MGAPSDSVARGGFVGLRGGFAAEADARPEQGSGSALANYAELKMGARLETTTTFMPSTAARTALAARFGLPYADSMQDWEWEVAEAAKFDEFLGVYRDVNLPDEERASLMEMLLQCIEETESASDFASFWSAIEPLLVARAALHRPTIAYWSCLSEAAPEHCFRVSPFMRRVWKLAEA